ncbi:MAG: agmatine deiminase family protein [Bacteroidales bacterium]|nr:agmatine deiminase family protein [Bacteroidales bacterium]
MNIPAYGQHPEWMERDGLPKGMTPEEELRRHEIGLQFVPTAPPEGPVKGFAEFNRLQGVLIRYPLGIPLSLVAAMSEHATVYTVVGSSWQQNQAVSAYSGAGVNLDNCEFIIAPTNSVWTRDYGPWFIADGNGEVAILDFPYNRPRPSDDAIPQVMADYFGVERYGMSVVHTGGNYMSDGMGVGASTDLVWEENSNNQNFVLGQMSDFAGIDTYHVTIDAQGDYIKHIDTWAKFLDVDKIMIAEVPSTHPRYWAYEQVANYFASQISSYGTPYQVFRVYAPNGQPYTNALILNERVYMPITGSSWDAAAIQAYEEAMPGYEVLGFTGSWQSTDALHCRVKDISDLGMLHIEHVPLHGHHEYQSVFEVEAGITAYSGAALYTDSLFVIYKSNENAFDTIPMVHASGNTYTGQIPVAPGDTLITYYLSASDASGRRETWPLIGAPGARSFTIDDAPEMYTVTFIVEDEDGAEINDAVITLDNVTNPPGDYVFVVSESGTRTFTIVRSCFATIQDQLPVSSDTQVEQVMYHIPGDANGDGVVNILDVVSIVNYFTGVAPDNFCFENADQNEDGVIDVIDLINTVNIFVNDQ